MRPAELGQVRLPRPIVLVNGCFDLLQTGHLMVLAHARSAAGPRGTLVLALDSDALVGARKGPSRPILTWAERATQLGWTTLIDYISEIRNDEEFVGLVEALEPDLRVRGGEYRGKPSRIKVIPTIWVPNLSGLSTTELIRRAVKSVST